MAEPTPIRDAHEQARRIRHDAERRARDITEGANREAKEIVAQARAAADAVLEDAKRLADALRNTSESLTAQADALVHDVNQAHRELLGSLRLPGVAERQSGNRPRPGPGEIFEPPDWIGRR